MALMVGAHGKIASPLRNKKEDKNECNKYNWLTGWSGSFFVCILTKADAIQHNIAKALITMHK